ncbi:MAG TPA: tetratricopeptide repeat protein [Vicinamibacterales bacterium]|nr:tetratricopeptide repeat protein [Vicinamibacterales bacterium]
MSSAWRLWHGARRNPGAKGARHPAWRALLGVAIVVAVLLPRSADAQTPASVSAPPAGILVAPFENDQRDAREYWLGEAAAVLVTDDLNARGLGALTRATRVRVFDQLHLPSAAPLSHATLIKVGEIAGAAQVIAGSLALEGDTLTARARAIRLDVGRAGPEVVERGPLDDLFAIFQRLSARLEDGGTAPAPAKPPPPGAFEQYIKGLLAEEPASQATFLETALELDPGYDRARLALWDVRMQQGDAAAALGVVRAVRDGSPLARRARFLQGVSQLQLGRDDDAFATFKALQGDAVEGAVLNNLGVAQLRRGGTTETGGTAAYFFTKATQADPDDPDFLFNLGYAYALAHDSPGAIYWLREALRREPADADAHFVLAAALDAAGTTVEGGRERELAVRLSSKYADRVRRAAAADLPPVPKGLERVRRDLESRRAERVDEAIVSSARQDQREQAAFHLERGRRFYEREQDRDALAELRRAVFLSPYEAEAHLLIGRIDLRDGRPRDAIDALKISIWSKDSAAAHVALADAYLRVQNSAAARAEVQRALALDPASTEAKRLLARIGGGG